MDEPVRIFLCDTQIPGDLGTEVMRVRAYSVAAVIGLRYHDGEQLALPA